MVVLVWFGFVGCQRETASSSVAVKTQNEIVAAKGLSIYRYQGYSLVTITNPWPNATKDYVYVLQRKGAVIPDSLKQYPTVPVPLSAIVVTSTTHIPSLEMLGVAETLVGFPNLDYVSSEKVRTRIDAGTIRELGSNQSLNTEVLLDLQPDLIVGFGIDNNNPALDNLQKSGLKVMLNGDWNEQTPLGKAEWIKFFGALYGKEKQADSIFNQIEKTYKQTLALAKNAKQKPTVMAGAIYENQWYLPHGNSWGSIFIADAAGAYLWADSHGTGSLSLPFEKVLEKAKDAEYWIGPAQYTSLAEMTADNPHYAQFKAFRDKKVFSFSTKKGAKGGLIFYELAPNRPDLVLQDMLRILHPELLPDHPLYFFEQLR
ncbi:iron complex transport system substrate-binding protein [Flavobacterium caeni]|uniref:Iron complex transport system substrate-binding protein n=2 Tax=Flavobacterium caeni TaxID=490189 RepID=A0A1G5HQV0_9FLAO|nr:iron complex transport system substrate-binding protein [Flavobacterium caeni]